MGDLKIKILEVKKPLDLVVVQILSLPEIGHILMVSKDVDRVLGAMQVAPTLQGAENHKKFAIVNVIVLLSSGEVLGKITTGVLSLI